MSSHLKILCLSPYPVEAASARLRILQFIPYLHSVGMDISYRPFMDSRVFSRFYLPGRRLQKSLKLLGSGLRRLSDLQQAKHCDLVLIHREAALMGPPVIEKMLARFIKKPIVFDLDDATYIVDVSPTYQNISRLVGFVKHPQKVPQIMSLSRSVIVGNRHLENYAMAFNPNVTLIPTVVDADVVKPSVKKQYRKGDKEAIVLGWIGTPSTYRYLEQLMPVIQAVARRHPIVLRIVGAGRAGSFPGVNVDNRAWGLHSELSDLQSFDIGLYPISDDVWSLGKSGFKAVQYMAVGIPTVCSPVGAPLDIVEDGVNGFFAANDVEWESRLCQLIEDAALRQCLGQRGRARVEEWYCLAHQAPRLQKTLLEAVGN